MSVIADNLLDLFALVPADMQPAAKPMLAGIMACSQELDRLHAIEVKYIRDESTAKIKAIRDEINDLMNRIETAEINHALTQLCRRHRLDPIPIISGLSDRCRYDDDGLTILDEVGVPITFRDAVCSLGGDDHAD